jgi:hypothetical protein
VERLDDAIRGAAPRPLGADPVIAAESQELARVIARITKRRVGAGRWRRILGGSVIGAGLFGVGVTAAVAGPALFEWVGWTPDAVVQRTFTIADGSPLGLCEVVARVVPEGGVPDATAEKRTEDARRFLGEHEWGPVVSSITAEEIANELAAEESRRANMAAGGASPPPVSAGVVASRMMGERIFEEFDRAGHMQPGVSLELGGHCDGEPESPAL